VGTIFSSSVQPVLGPTQLSIEWVPGLFRGLTTRPHLAPRLHKQYSYTSTLGYAVAQLVEALHYKPEGRGDVAGSIPDGVIATFH
jgi:hypothetical protein